MFRRAKIIKSLNVCMRQGGLFFKSHMGACYRGDRISHVGMTGSDRFDGGEKHKLIHGKSGEPLPISLMVVGVASHTKPEQHPLLQPSSCFSYVHLPTATGSAEELVGILI